MRDANIFSSFPGNETTIECTLRLQATSAGPAWVLNYFSFEECRLDRWGVGAEIFCARKLGLMDVHSCVKWTIVEIVGLGRLLREIATINVLVA